jgi:hypothetical protein
MDLRPNRAVQKVLISSPSRLYGEYQSPDLLITHAWRGLPSHKTPPTERLGEGPRNAFVCAFETSPEEPGPGVPVQFFSGYGEHVCLCLAVLFGKRFDSHGLLENGGMFLMPDMRVYNQPSASWLPQNTKDPRIDYAVPLNLVELSRIRGLLVGEHASQKAARTFTGAGKFYLQALQSIEHDPEVAYLHLITAGEILSNFVQYPKEELLDDTTKKLMGELRAMPDGCKLATHVEGKLRSIKKRFVRTITDLVDPAFFTRTQSSVPFAAFKKEDFAEKIKAAYDLRSRYVHTGVPFGMWVATPLVAGAEVMLGSPVLDDRELVKVVSRAPSYTGLERVIRYCLLRFAEANDLYSAPAVVLPPPGPEGAQSVAS